jgi:hypothetical protein
MDTPHAMIALWTPSQFHNIIVLTGIHRSSTNHELIKNFRPHNLVVAKEQSQLMINDPIPLILEPTVVDANYLRFPNPTTSV